MASKYASRKPLIVLLCCVIISGVTSIEDLEIINPPRDAYALKDAPLLLDCATSGQRPIVVIWRRGDEEINLDGERSVLANGSLLIDAVLPKKDAGRYQCCASNELGTICSSRVTVTIAILPRFDVHPEPTTVREGGTARFVCHTQAAPPPTITWKQGKRTLDPTTDTRVTVLPQGVLQIVNVSPTDAGDYRCIAVNIADKRRSQPAALVVQPRVGGGPVDPNINIPQIIAGPAPLTRVVGESAVFECLVDGDKSLAVSWSRQDGKEIRTQGVYYTGRRNLHFNSVATSDAGVYLCTARNKTGSQVQAAAELTVYIPPTIVVAPDPISGPVAINARFSCEAEGHPRPRIHWVHNGLQVTQTGRYALQTNDDLVIAGVWETDKGIIQCVAENEVGIRTASAKLTVSAHPPIPPPRNIRGIVLDSSSILVTWMPPENSGTFQVIAYTLHYQRADGGLEFQQPVGENTLSYRVEELEPSTLYVFYLQCWTSKGPSPPSLRGYWKTEEAPPETAPVFTLSSNSEETITIQWQPLPERERNGVVTMYKIVCNIEAGTSETEREWEVNRELTEYTIINLEGDTWYEVRMAAKTLQYGPFSEWVSVKTWVPSNPNVSTPYAPHMELDTPDPTSIRVHLGPPRISSVIIGYKVFYKQKGQKVEEGPVSLPAMVTEHTFENLEEETTYEIRALAYNQYGDGHHVVQAITTRRALPPPPEPYVPSPKVVNLTALSPRVIRLTWQRPQTNQLIKAYTIKYWHHGNKSTAMERVVPASLNRTDTTFDIGNLLPFSQYVIQVRSHSSKGIGPYSDEWMERTLQDRPSPPSDATAEPVSDNTIIVQWQPPKSPNGVLTHFVIMYNRDLHVEDGNWKHEERDGTARSANVEGLNSATKYYFKVRAGTQAGEGPPTEVIEAETLAPPPPPDFVAEKGILIGTCLALSCIICCSVFIFCKRRVLCAQNSPPHVASQPVNGGPGLRHSVKVYMANTNGEDPDASFTQMLPDLPEPINLDTKGGSPLIINGNGPVHGPYLTKGNLPQGAGHPTQNHCHGSPLDLEDGGSTSLSSTDPDGSGTALLAAEVKHQRSQELHDSGTEIPMSSLDNAATNTQDLSCHGNSCSGNHSLNQELPHHSNTCPLLLASSHDTGVYSNNGVTSRGCDSPPNNLPHQNGHPVTTSGVYISSDSGSPSPAKSRAGSSATTSPHRKEPVRLKQSTGKILPHRSPSTQNDTMVPLEDIWERRCATPATTQNAPLSKSSTTPTSATTSTTDSVLPRNQGDGPRHHSPSLNCDTNPDFLQRATESSTSGRSAKTCTV